MHHLFDREDVELAHELFETLRRVLDVDDRTQVGAAVGRAEHHPRVTQHLGPHFAHLLAVVREDVANEPDLEAGRDREVEDGFELGRSALTRDITEAASDEHAGGGRVGRDKRVVKALTGGRIVERTDASLRRLGEEPLPPR